MNISKNTIIGLLIVAIVLVGGYFLLKDKNVEITDNEPSTSQTENTTTTKVETTTTTTTTAPTPNAPTVQTSESVSASSSTAIVSGQVKPNGASTTYWFEYGETTALGSRTVSQAIGSGYSQISTPAYITGLKANTLYHFRLSASNRLATTNGVTFNFRTNDTPPPRGIAPTTRTNSATDISRTTANLNGQVNPNGYATTYWFEYGTENTFGSITALQSAGNGTALSQVSVSASGLAPLTKYYFRLNAQNQFGTINGSIMSFVTKGPAAPSSPIVNTNGATNISDSSARLNGSINPNGSETTYWFEYSQDSLLASLIGSGTSAKIVSSGNNTVNVQADVSNLNSDAKYYYRLVGRNQYGTTLGDIMSFKTKN